MTARDEMNRLFQQAKDLEARRHTAEAENALRARARVVIKDACGEQHKENGSVFTPSYCLACEGCVIQTIVIGVSKQ